MIVELKDIVKKIIDFRDERDWKQFHNPKDLAISLNIEASELLECFQWKSNDEVESLLKSNEKSKIEEEIADIAMYLLLLCHETDINLEETILKKLEKNSEKYPIEKSKGSSKKYNQL